MAEKQKSSKSGRNKKKCEQYKLAKTREKNRAVKLARLIRRHTKLVKEVPSLHTVFKQK